MELRYFSGMAKGLGPALVAEMSGLPWKGPKDLGFTKEQWFSEFKESGRPPFKQLPLLEVDDLRIGQTVAVINYIGRKAGTLGDTDKDFATSQMLLGEGEDLYLLMEKYNPSFRQKLGDHLKGNVEDYNIWWNVTLKQHLGSLEALVLENTARFTTTGVTVGEIHLWSMLHQIKLVKPSVFNEFPKVAAFYSRLENREEFQRVLKGESTYGEFRQYFLPHVSE